MGPSDLNSPTRVVQAVAISKPVSFFWTYSLFFICPGVHIDTCAHRHMCTGTHSRHTHSLSLPCIHSCTVLSDVSMAICRKLPLSSYFSLTYYNVSVKVESLMCFYKVSRTFHVLWYLQSFFMLVLRCFLAQGYRLLTGQWPSSQGLLLAVVGLWRRGGPSAEWIQHWY